MQRASIFIVGCLLWASSAAANGGGYDFGVSFTGAVAPFQAQGTQNVRILEEKLDVALRRTDAAVVVRYTMQNLASSPVTVRFGFPVEAVDDREWLDEETRPPSGEMLRRAMQQLKGYTVSLNGAPVKAQLVVEPFASGKVKPFPGSAVLEGIAGWMVSEVAFPAGGPVALEIRYAADHKASDMWVSDDARANPRVFRYRLSTGAVWKGTIAKGTVSLRADGIPADEVEIIEPRDRFHRDGDGWVWTFEELEPTLADDITVRAIPRYSISGFYGDGDCDSDCGFLEREERYGRAHTAFTAKASSTLRPSSLRSYGPENLARSRVESAWSEGRPGNGIGEWVELRPSTPRPLLAISIFPGFQSSLHLELFEANGRPARVEILLNDEHRFVATLGDARGGQLIPILGYTKPVSKLRITIGEVFPGKKYADTCITRVVLYDLLTEKPEIHHAR